MSEWKTYKLGDLPIQFIDGDRGKNYPKGEDFSEVGHCLFLNAGNVTKNGWNFSESVYISQEKDNLLRNGKLERGDIVLTTRGTVGNVVLYSDDIPYKHIRINSGMVIIRNNNTCYNPYLYQYLRSYLFLGQVQQFQSGSAQPQIPISTLKKLTISLPPLTEQKRIADMLSAIDDKIELNRRINANLEQQAQALYKSWFVDFEPFGGKMPENWREGVISDIVDLLNGFAFKSSDFVENGLYKLITIKGVQDGKMSLDGADCLNVIPPKMPQWCKLKKEDILLSLTGNVGRCCLVDTENCLLNQRVAKLQPKEEYNRLFIYALFRQEDMKARMISIARGTAQMNLSPIETGKLPLIIPSNEVLKDFGNRFNNIIHILTNNIVESSYLAQLRDTLLPKLMSGEIKA